MTDKLHLTIDSYGLYAEIPGVITLPLEQCNIQNYTRVALKQMYLHHDNDIRILFKFKAKTEPIYVHCSLLNKDDNIVNGKKSDVLAIIVPEIRTRVRDFCAKPPVNSFKLAKPDSKITMYLTSLDGTPVDNRSKFRVVYELEFS